MQMCMHVAGPWVCTGDSAAVALLGRVRDSHRIVICGQVKQEVLQGSRDKKAFAKLEQEMSIWDDEPEQPEDFVSAARVYAELRWKGVTVPAADCLIAALARRKGWSVCATDPTSGVEGSPYAPSLITRHDSISNVTSPIVSRVWSRRLEANCTNR